MKSVGTDYGLGITNTNELTGIRYGVIHQNEVLQAWADCSEPCYAPAQYDDLLCPDCYGEPNDEDFLNREWGDWLHCPQCKHSYEVEMPDFVEPYQYHYIEDNYIIQQQQDDPDLFVIKSPYYTYAGFCSPCAPGAGDLNSYFVGPTEWSDVEFEQYANEAGYPRVYCLGDDWFDSGKAPYRIFERVTDAV